MTLRNRLGLFALCAALSTSVMGSSHAETDKARFAARLGVAYYCFHHWVSNPYREGKFVGGALHRKATIVKSGTALLYAVRELKAAKQVAAAGKDTQVQSLVRSIDSMADSFDTVGRKFKSGKFTGADIDTLNGVFTTMDSSARAAKIEVKDVPITVPGA